MKTTTRWTPEEECFVKENWGILSPNDVANALNRTVGSVSTKACYMRVRRIYICKECGDKFSSYPAVDYCKKCNIEKSLCPICGVPVVGTKSKPRITCSFQCKQIWCSSRRTAKIGHHGLRKTGEPSNIKVENNGYILRYFPEHPMSTSRGYVLEHRMIMANKIGRMLSSRESVHHVNGKKDDNRPENLEIRIRVNHPNGVGERDMVKTLQSLGYTISKPEVKTNKQPWRGGW